MVEATPTTIRIPICGTSTSGAETHDIQMADECEDCGPSVNNAQAGIQHVPGRTYGGGTGRDLLSTSQNSCILGADVCRDCGGVPLRKIVFVLRPFIRDLQGREPAVQKTEMADQPC